MRVVYIHHPKHHPTHAVYAKAVGADFLVQDFYFPYCQIKKNHRFRRYVSWLLLWIRFPYKKYDIILTDEPQFYACILKILSLGRLKLVATQASISLNRYFNGTMPVIGGYIFKRACNLYNLIIAIGDIQCSLAKQICCDNTSVKIERSFNGVSEKFTAIKERAVYNPLSKNIIAISNIPSDEIANVKGADLMIRTFIEIKKERADLNFFIIGDIDPDLLKKYETEYNLKEYAVHFIGPRSNLEEFYNDAVCAFHFSRMDAWPLAVTELMFVGIPTFISTKVGAKSIYENLKNAGQFLIDIDDIKKEMEKIKLFLSLKEQDKIEISNACKEISKDFTEIKAAENYKKIFRALES